MEKRLAVTAMLAAVVGVLASCTSTVDGTPSAAAVHAFPSSPTPSRSSSAPAGASAAALVTRVFAAMKASTAFSIVANDTNPDGSKFALDAHFGPTSTMGTVAQGNQSVQVIAVPGTIYFKGNDQFWESIVPPSKQTTLLPRLRGKWVTGPPSDPGLKDLSESISSAGLISSLTEGDPPSDYTVIGLGTRDGSEVTRLRDSSDDSELDVLANGTPYPLYAAPGPSDGVGGAVFGDWNKPFTAHAPPKREVFDATPYLD